MKSIGLLAILASLALGLAVDANAKGSRGSHASLHTNNSHAGEGGGGIIRNAIARPHRTERSPGSGNAESQAAHQAPEATPTKANTEAEAAAQEKRQQRAEQAAAASREEQKRLQLEAAARDRQLAALERLQHQATWEARCQIQPVMSDLEISTCREVWSNPAP